MASPRKKTLRELINLKEPGWPVVRAWLESATNSVEVLPRDPAAAEKTLLALQVTTRSPMGAIALETGGLLFDHAWLRVLGSGSERVHGSLLTWNWPSEGSDDLRVPGLLVVAHDAAGGFFVLNGGALSGAAGNVFYRAPDTLEWEDTGTGYSDFVYFAAHGDLALFYEGVRWPGWEREVEALSGDRGLFLFPPLWSKLPPEQRPADRHRGSVPMTELWSLWADTRRQLADVPDGAKVRLVVDEGPRDAESRP